MRIAVAQTAPLKGDISGNIARHLALIRIAAEEKADMIIFSELSLTGYEPSLASGLATVPEDPRFGVFQEQADTQRMIIGAGIPLKIGPGVSISMLLFSPGNPVEIYSKQYLHEDELPYFVPGITTARCIDQYRVGLAICYELSVPEHSLNEFRKGKTIYIASAAKTKQGVERAHEQLKEIAVKYQMTVLLSNCTGICDGEIAGGRSAAWDRNGKMLGLMDDQQEGLLILDTISNKMKICYRNMQNA